MSDNPNGSRESIDTSPLTLDQLSDQELEIILSIEHQLEIMRAGAAKGAKNAKNAKPYLASVQVRRPQVLLLDGSRGTGKTSLLLTMAHRWNIHSNCDVERHDHNLAQYEVRVARIRERSQLTYDGTISTHLQPLRILDFDPLPPQMPLIAGIVQAWQPLAKKYDKLSRRPADCDDEGETLEDRWNALFRVATVGWSAVPTAKGLLEQVLDRQEQITEWQRLGRHWQEFVTAVIKCGRCLQDLDKLGDDPIFVIMIDDVDLQVKRIRELLPALRLLYHPNVAFLVAAHWEHLVDTLENDFRGQQNRLANRKVDRNATSADGNDKWSGTLALAAATKVFPRKNRWSLTKLTLHDLLAFPEAGYERGDTSARTTMRTILNERSRLVSTNGGRGLGRRRRGLGEYLHEMAGPPGDPYEIPPFITYRDAHQILERASMQSDGAARATEAVRLLISEPESDAVVFKRTGEREPIVEFRGIGQLVALFRPGPVEETSASTEIVLGARPDFFYRAQPSSEAIFMQGYVGTKVNFTSAMLAVSIQDYDIAAPSLKWDIHLALVWTRVEVSDENSLLKLALQWRFHVHPHPFELLGWSHEWREFVRTFQDNTDKALERIAYAWIFYQLKWLGAKMGGVASPLKIDADFDTRWKKLLTLNPPAGGEGTRKSRGRLYWRTRTLPLLARPEIGLPPDMQVGLLDAVRTDGCARDANGLHVWLKGQRRRLITDAIIAGAEEEGRRAENAENPERVESIVKECERLYAESSGGVSPWQKMVEPGEPKVNGDD